MDYADKKVAKNNLEKLWKNFKRSLDEKELKYLIITGVAPTLDEILNKF